MPSLLINLQSSVYFHLSLHLIHFYTPKCFFLSLSLSLSPTWFFISLVLVFRIGESENRVVGAGQARAAAGLQGPPAPQLDGALRGHDPLRVRVGIRSGVQTVSVLQQAYIGTIYSGWRRRLTHVQICQCEAPCNENTSINARKQERASSLQGIPDSLKSWMTLTRTCFAKLHNDNTVFILLSLNFGV